MRRTLVPLLGLALATASAGVAAAERSAPGRGAQAEPQLTAEPPSAQPGSSVTLSGRGFPRNARIALLAGPPHAEAERIGTAQTGRRGTFSATIRIRVRSDTGRLVALACHDACRVKASAAFRIVPR